LLRILILIVLSSSVLGEGVASNGKEKVAACVACHGADGNSLVGIWPTLAAQNEKYLLGQLRNIQSGKRVIIEMTGLLDDLNEQDLADISAYFASQNNINGTTSEKYLDLGSKLYYSGSIEKGIPACTACHSPSGKGNALAGYPSLGGQKKEYLDKTLKEYRSGKRSGNEQALIMQSVSSKLNDAEIEALANFIHGLY
jgi:cytochrome c553